MLHKTLSYRQEGTNVHVNCVDFPLLHVTERGPWSMFPPGFDVIAKQERCESTVATAAISFSLFQKLLFVIMVFVIFLFMLIFFVSGTICRLS
jgi:hypothetical protein